MSVMSNHRELLATLAWQRAMGADAAVGADAVDWLARGDTAPGAGYRAPHQEAGRQGQSAAAAPAAAPSSAHPATARAAAPAPAQRAAAPAPATRSPAGRPAQANPRQFSTAMPDAAETAARTAARAARTLDELEQALATFDGCSLKATAKNLCFYRGATTARLMLIGEAPGREEDLEGSPFVGRAGQLLEKMLAAAGFEPASVHITNVVYWRPPGNRTPTPVETQLCRPFMERQIELVAPEIVMPLGGAAAKQVCHATEGIMRVRGKWQDVTFGGHTCRAMASLHPAYLLRTPIAKRLAWRDLLAVAAALGVESGKKG